MSIKYGHYCLEMIQMQLFYLSAFVVMIFIGLNTACLFFGVSTIGLVLFTGGGAILTLLSYGIVSLILKVKTAP